MKKGIETLLGIFARALVQKYKPTIVGITGSVGKTSAKWAVSCVLKKRFHVRSDKKTLNTEIGFPLAILGEEYPGKSVLGWLRIFFRAAFLMVVRGDFPQILVLEYGADKSGDIAYLLTIAKPHIAVLTGITWTHTDESLGQFSSLEAIQKEKSLLLRAVDPNGAVILNTDFRELCKLKDDLAAHVTTYGLESGAEVFAKEVVHQWGKGVRAKIAFQGSEVPVFLAEAASSMHLVAALAATSVGLRFKMNLHEIAQMLGTYIPAPGRMHYVEGIKHTTIIDDTYNSAALLGAKNAVDFLESYQRENEPGMKKCEKFLVLGDMNELGAVSSESHEALGRHVAETKSIDWLVVSGEKAKVIARSAQEHGMSEDRVFSFDKPQDTGKFLQSKMQEGDVILLKGSQNGVFLEEAVKEIMAEPLRAKELLVRQDDVWMQKKRALGMVR